MLNSFANPTFGRSLSAALKTAGRTAGLAAALALGAGLSPALWAAGPVDDAQAMISQGDLAGALKKLDSYLASSPQDAEARFTRGLVLVKLDKTQEAIAAFAELTRDYPQLPEPYNNLAVLYAQAGDYEKARSALEAALATHPSYATAHENLGDIYAALAGAAYNRALLLDQGNQGVRYKLSLINQLNSVAGGAAPAPAPLPPPPAAPVSQRPAAPVAAPAVPVPVPAAPAASAPVTSVDEAAINAVLSGWAQAWSSKDVDGYIGYYAQDFRPEQGLSHDAWTLQRRERLTKPTQITVAVSNVKITPVNAQRVQVSFVQDYQADALNDRVTKVLELQNIGGAWKIVRENVR